jgi:hypothetical protein
MQVLEARWRMLFDLAWNSKGLVVDISRCPDNILLKMVDWRNEAVENENAAIRQR